MGKGGKVSQLPDGLDVPSHPLSSQFALSSSTMGSQQSTMPSEPSSPSPSSFLDPRSPSIATRTPQQVPVASSAFDPRSPSTCVTRTPLEKSSEEFWDPRSPSAIRTPVETLRSRQKELHIEQPRFGDSPFQPSRKPAGSFPFEEDKENEFLSN